MASKIFDATLRLVDKFSKPLEVVDGHLTKFEKHYKATGKSLWATGKTLEGIGKGMTKYITAPIVAVGAMSAKSFKEVDDAMDTIVTKTGATGKAMDGFKGNFQNIVKRVPADLQDVGDAIGEVNTQFGLTGKALESASEYMIKFAKINGQDITQASIQAKQAMDSYGLGAKDLNKVLDAVTVTAQATGQGTDALFQSLIKSAPQLKAMGIGVEQGVAFLGGLEKQGIDTGKAMSYMSRAQVAFAKDGKSMGEGLKLLQQRLKGATTDADKMNIASEYFGSRGASFMLDAIKRGALDFDAFADAVQNAQGAVDRTFNEARDPVDNFKLLFNQLKLAGADLFEASQGVWGPLLEKAIGKVQKLTEWFRGLSDEQKQNIVKWAGMAAAIGPMLIGFSKIIFGVSKVNYKLFDFAKAVNNAGGITKWFGGSGIGKMLGAFGKLGKIVWRSAGALVKFVVGLGPVGWAIMAVIAVIILLIINWKKIKPVVTRVIHAVVGRFKYFKRAVTQIFHSIIERIQGFVEGAKALFRSITSYISGAFMSAWRSAWHGVVSAFRSIFGGVKRFGKSVMNGLIRTINRALSGLNKIQVPDWVPGVGGKGINIPLIPQLAKGTDFWKGGLVQIHEKGGEIVDLPRGSRVLPHDKTVSEAYKMGAKHNSTTTNLTIPKLADQIIVREDADIERIANALYKKLKIAKYNKIGAV